MTKKRIRELLSFYTLIKIAESLGVLNGWGFSFYLFPLVDFDNHTKGTVTTLKELEITLRENGGRISEVTRFYFTFQDKKAGRVRAFLISELTVKSGALILKELLEASKDD